MLVLALSACAAEMEGPPELPALAPAPCTLETHSFRIDALELPANAREAESLGLDLDFDPEGQVDNAGGVVLATLGRREADESPALAESLQRALGKGALRWFVHVSRCRDHVRIELGEAAVPGARAPATGTVDRDGVMRAAEGIGRVPLSALFEPDGTELPVIWAAGMGLAFELTETEGAIAGRFGIGISHTAIDAAPSRDAFVRAVLVPDVDLTARHEGRPVYWPSHDGTRDHMSLGLGFHATRI
jgi:hypothetical protein